MTCSRCGSLALNNHGDTECLMCGTIATPIRAWDTVSDLPAQTPDGRVRKRRPSHMGPRVLPEERAAWAAMERGDSPAHTVEEWDSICATRW